jgi:high-affinity iron transporter
MKQLLGVVLGVLLFSAARADVQTLLQLVDYMGVDYAGAVENGVIVNEFEYAEMVEFGGRIQSELDQLQTTAATPQLNTLTQQLTVEVNNKAAPAVIAGLTQSIRELLMTNYNIVLTPKGVPDIARAKQLYTENCASCHGETGRGDGMAAVGMEPAPTDFYDTERAHQRSLFGLYNTITLGVGGTPMPARPDLSDMDRWALAFYVGGMYADAATLQAGEAAMQQQAITLNDAVTLSPAELAATNAQGVAIAAWVRQNPGSLFTGKADPLDVTRDFLAQSVQLYKDGNIKAAADAAVTGYLEGFELIEAPLSNVDAALMKQTEAAMMAFRHAIAQQASTEQVEAHYTEVLALLDQSTAALQGEALSPSVAFSGSLIILLREGLEIILVLAAIITFLVKSGRSDALRYVHAGWILALVAGVATWAVSSYVFTISGATREVTEGVTALLAAVILLYVGFWMHRNANAKRWSEYLKSQVQTALDTRTLWTLAVVSFLAVYREIFEIILFYQALWAQVNADSHRAVFYGAVLALALLALMTWLIFRFGMRLPLKQFFTASAIIMIALAFIFTGKGIAALQEAGSLATSPVPFPTIELLGIYPNLQALVLQAIVVVLALVIFFYDRKDKKTA